MNVAVPLPSSAVLGGMESHLSPYRMLPDQLSVSDLVVVPPVLPYSHCDMMGSISMFLLVDKLLNVIRRIGGSQLYVLT
jgi:hypothetical protein